MTKVILEAGDNYIAASAATIYGSTGSETVKIQDGVTVTTDASVERIEFTRASSDYSYKATSTGVQVSYNGTVVANLATGGKVAFTNGSAAIASSFDATTGTATFTLGGKAVPTTATTGTVLAPTVSNATGEASTLTPSTATSSSTYSIAAAAGSVTEGGAVAFTVTASSASATATTLSYQISGVAVGASVNAASTADFSSVTGTVTLPANATTATFSVVPTNDGVVEGFEGFKVSLLDSSFNTVATSGSVVIADGVSSGQAFTLTVGADTTLVGGAGNDTFTGLVGTNGLSANGTTLNAGDVLDGGAGTDTLNISISGTNTGGATTTTSAVTLSGIENISVNNYGTAGTPNDNTINLAQATGVTNISLASSAASGDTNFTVVRNLVTAGMGNGAGDLSIQYTDTAVAGTADTQTLNLTGQTGGTFTVTAATTGGIESLNIASNTVANTIAVASSTLTAITITGDQNLTLTEGTTNTLTSVNASALTGKLVFTTDDVTAINVVGGSADDKVTLGTTFTSADSINGGTGNDTLSIGTTIGASTDLVNVTNIETLAITGNNNVTLATNVSPTIFDLSAVGTNGLTLSSGYTNATTVKISSGDTVNNSGAKVNLTVNLAGAALNTNTTITGGTGTTAGTDTLNLTADSTASAGTDFTNITNVESIVIVDGGDDALAGLKPAGQDVNLNLGSYAQTLIIDASALDAASIDNNADGKINDSDISAEVLTVTGGSAATLNITGGAAADQITAGAQNDTINGGAGNDTIDTGNGNNSVLGGAGSDTITAGTGNDYIDGGADNDKFILAGNLTVGDTIIGGDGNDTLVVNSVTSAALANVSGVENLQFSGDVSLSSNISFSSFNLADATAGQALTLASGYTNATTVSLGEGDATTGDKVDNTGANATLTVNAYGAAFVDAGPIDTSASVFGGTGTDTVNLTADSSNVSFAGLITGVDVVNIIDGGDDAATGTKPAGQDITLTLGSYATALTIDGSALDAATVDTNADSNLDDEAAAEVLTVSGGSVLAKFKVTGGAAADNITTGSGAYNDTVDGGAGNDSISSGAGNDSILGGDGNDIITFAGNLTGDDTVNGGTGSNTLIVSSAGDLNFLNVSNIQTLKADTGSATYTIDTRAQAAGITTITDTNLSINVDASGFTNGLTFKTTGGNDSLVSGTGNDTFVFAGTVNLDANDTIKAGAGTDTIRLDNAASATAAGAAVSVTLGTVTGVENILVNDLSNVANDVAGDVSITFNSVYAQNNITIDGSALDTGETLTVDASANIADNTSTTAVNEAEAVSVIGGAASDTLQGGAAADVLVGNAGADTLVGNAGADTIDGGAGSDNIDGGLGADSITGGDANDTITGGAGADNLTGGAGNDVFVYTASSESTTGSIDTITDFTSGADKLDLSAILGNSIGLYMGSAATDNATKLLFTASGTSPQAAYNVGDKLLYVDLDHNGLINSSDLVISLPNVSTLTYADLGSNFNDSSNGAGLTKALTASPTDSLLGGAGNDTFTVATATDLQSGDRIDGDLGTDTLQLNAAGNFSLSGVTLTSIEAISSTVTTGTVTITDGGQIGGATIAVTAASAGNAVVVVTKADDLDLTNVTLTNVDSISTTKAGAASITLGAGVTTSASQVSSIVGVVSQTNTLALDVADRDLTGTTLTSIEAITVADGAAQTLTVNGSDIASGAVASVTFTTGTNTDTLAFAGSALNLTSVTLSNVDTISSLATTGAVTITVGSNTSNLVNGAATVAAVAGSTSTLTSAASTLNLTSTTLTNIDKISDSYASGATITLGTNVTTSASAVSTIGGGAGTDTLALDVADRDLTGTTLTSIEAITVADGAAQTLTVNGSDIASGAVASVTFTTGTNTDTLAFAGSALNLTSVTLSNVDTISSLATTGAVTITDSGSIVDGATITVGAVSGANVNLVGAGDLDLTNVTFSNIDTVTLGSAGTLTFGASSDDATTYVGSSGNDTFLTAAATTTQALAISLGSVNGGGHDIVSLDAVGTNTGTGVVAITGFTAGTGSNADSIYLSGGAITSGNIVLDVQLIGAAVLGENGNVGDADGIVVLSGSAFQISGNLTSTTGGGAVESAIVAAKLTGVSDSTYFYAMLDNGTETGIYRVDTGTVVALDTTTTGLLDDHNDFGVTLVGTIDVSNANSFVLGNFAA
jgi:Ca2+-binding RTX toxin-like protein